MRSVLSVVPVFVVLVACSSTSSSGPSTVCPADGGVCRSDADCDDHVFCNGIERCMPGGTGANACGCMRAYEPRCSAGYACIEGTQRCILDCGTAPDADGDGHRSMACGGDDCDDNDPRRYPGNEEFCDADLSGAPLDPNHDEDCDASTVGTKDNDRDGYVDAICCNTDIYGHRHCGLDCDDTNAGVHPGLPELCNNRDDNCDGNVDEGVKVTLYVDADHDGYGAPGPGSPQCPGASGYSALANDCDDANPAIVPGAFTCSGAANTDTVAICDWTGGAPGTYVASTCSKGFICVPQPNGTGVCR